MVERWPENLELEKCNRFKRPQLLIWLGIDYIVRSLVENDVKTHPSELLKGSKCNLINRLADAQPPVIGAQSEGSGMQRRKSYLSALSYAYCQ